MKITVLNGSPKGETSVTMQYVYYLQKMFPQHELDIINVGLRLKSIERDEQAFQAIVDAVRDSDGVLWAFPLYVMLVPANYKRFIELIWERGVLDAFEDKYAAVLTTSIHFYDHTAHNYMRAICDDLGMRYAASYSAEMRDLLDEDERAKFMVFARTFFGAIEDQMPTVRAYAPVMPRTFEYVPGALNGQVRTNGKKVVIITDAEPHQANLLRMVERVKSSFSPEAELINLRDLDIKGSCIGCLRCGYDNQCTYQGKDEYMDVYNTRLKTADVLVFAGAMQDRYLSAMWKTFFDRAFFNGHAPSLIGKQFSFIISGPLSQNANLREILEAWVQIQRSNVAGFVTDEFGDSAQIDALLQSLAGRLIGFAESGYVQPQTFLGVGGTKLFRDEVWGRLRTVFQADHRAYRRLGVYDFPQKELGVRALNGVTTVLFKVPRIRQEFAARIKEGMVQPYGKVLNG